MKIKKLKIKGFRGFTQEQRIDLTSRVTIIFGENSHGKSSILNAIEWCLFGDDCKKTKPIRERKGWMPENKHGDQECRVELVCEREDGEIVFTRVIAPSNKGLGIKFSNGEEIKEETANEWVAANIGSFTEFMATVYQHQENIRHLATAGPTEKSELISRLLGLGDYTELLAGIRSSNAHKAASPVTECISEIERTITIQTKDLQERIQLIGDDIGVNPNIFSLEELTENTANLSNRIAELYKSIRVDKEDQVIPGDIVDFPDFIQSLKNDARELLSKSPDESLNHELSQKISQLDSEIANITASKGRTNEATKGVNDFIKAQGDRTKLDQNLTEIKSQELTLLNKIKSMSEMQAALFPIYDYLESNELGTGDEECIACGNGTADQKGYLKSKLDELTSEPIKEANEQLQKIRGDIHTISGHITTLASLEAELKTSLELHSNNIHAVLQKYELIVRDGEDVIKLLNQEKADSFNKQESLKVSIKQMRDNVTTCETNCDRLNKMVDLIKYKDRINHYSTVKESDDYKAVEGLENDAEQFSMDIEAIVEAIKSIRDGESASIIEDSKENVKTIFNKISENPGITNIDMVLETSRGNESFSFKDDNNNEVLPIMGQGDMNALALSIFTGLGEANIDSLPLKSIIFDDPSQNMGTHHKGKFAEVINDIAEKRQVIVSTMDNEFMELLNSKILMEQSTIEIEGWEPETGPILNANAA